MDKLIPPTVFTQLAKLKKRKLSTWRRDTCDMITAALHQACQQHEDVKIRYELISRLLAAQPVKNTGLTQFYALLENDFMSFSEKISMKTEARALKTLQSVGHELEMLAGSPDVHKRSIVAVVGGFSSGKSAFINSFIQDKNIHLSVGIQPVTVIPSYVYASADAQPIIRGYSSSHGFTELDSDFYQGLSHAFIDSFDFNLRSLMPFVCLGIKMDAQYFGNLCFIDTPGYNPPATSNDHSAQDKATAIEFAQQANAIVWLIGLDATGTIPQSDIDFIHEISHDGQPVYVVFNKADLKPHEQIEAIMDEAEAILAEEGLAVHGMCAYSSVRQRNYGYRNMQLMAYFSAINQPNNAWSQKSSATVG